MINSSPDYTITKPGVRPLSRKRDKPLRTYGRQATATPEPRSEPPAKRARTTYAIHDDDDKNVKPLGTVMVEDDAPAVVPIFPAKPPPAKEDQENQLPSKPEPNVPAKRSILNYFKPVTTYLTPMKPAKTNILPDTEPAEAKKAEKQAQPSSYPKKRVLRVRPNQSIGSIDDNDENYEHNCECEEGEPKVTRSSEPRSGRRKRRLGGSDSSARSDSRRVRRKYSSAEVQTTLNISNQAAFSECKECDTVWNPLYPDDVKYHIKRHAAYTRTKKKKLENDL